MYRLKFIGVLFLISTAICFGVALPGFTQNEIMQEQTISYVWGGDVDVHINAPDKDSLKLDKETIIVFYALPAGNTIEQTIGKQPGEAVDWHFDIQHIGAQTRFLRHTLKDKNIITIYIQPTNTSWSGYDDNHPNDYVDLIQSMTRSILLPFSEFNYKVTLNSHSAGGSWILRYIDGVTEIPSWIDRLAFIDSDYNYRLNPYHYDSIFDKFLNDRDSTYLCVMAYNDSIALLDGVPFIGSGGTWCTTKFMKSRLESYFTFVDSHDVDFYRYVALDKRFEILMKKNPTRAILHTVQVYKNGFIHSMLNGTEYENVGYEFYGDPVYLEYIQGNPPGRPDGVSATPTFGGFRLQINPVDDATGYRVYFSEDGETISDTIQIDTCDVILSGLTSNGTNYIKISAINRWGESYASEWLVVTPGDQPYTMLLVNAFNRTKGHNYLVRHGRAAEANYIPLGSCTNSMIISEKVEMNNFHMVNYVVASEGRRDYTLVTEEINKIESYLRQGGNLFMSGLEIAYDLDVKGDSVKQAFCHDFLKMKGISDKPNELSSTYYEASFKGFDFFDTTIVFDFDDGTHGMYNASDPDGIQPINGSYRSVVFSGYDASVSCAGVAYSGEFPGGTAPGRVFVMTIPFETILGDSTRDAVMTEIVSFLTTCGVNTDPVDIPLTTALYAPYPNPFNPTVTVNCQLSHTGDLDMSIYNLRGQKVHTLYSGKKEAGAYAFNWKANDYASGIYLCVMQIDGMPFATQKMVLVK